MAALGYTQLDRSRKTIRLLTLAPGDAEEQIRCELTHADLDDSPSFIALSYTWDQGGGYDEIECCGATTQVGKNLRNFLFRFRIWDEGRGSRLWIDALCINQNDVNERNHQVVQMRTLFSTATSTIAWLGETGGESDLVYSYNSISQNSIGYINDTRQALSCLLNREYWWRVWVIQEFLLPLHLYVWWDGYRMRAQDFSQVVWTMAGLSSGCSPQYPSIWNTPGRNLLQYRERYQRMSRSNGVSAEAFRKTMGLQPLLQGFSTSKCSLIHDRVYGLLGIAIDADHSTWPIQPDYGNSPAQLLLDVLQNQRREESDATGETRKLIDELCKLLELNNDERFAKALRIAPMTIQEAFPIRSRWSRWGIHVPSTFYGTISTNNVIPRYKKSEECGFPDYSFPFEGTFQEHTEIAVLESSVCSIRNLEGCLVALGEYLDSYPLAEPYIPSDTALLYAWILGLRISEFGLRNIQTTRFTRKISRWHGTNASKVTELLYSLGERAFYSGPFYLAFIHKCSGVHLGRNPLSVVPYWCFGEFGIALLLKCGQDCNSYLCRYPAFDHEPKVVGTAFFCKL